MRLREELLMDGEPVPEQAPLEEHRANDDGDGIRVLVTVDRDFPWS